MGSKDLSSGLNGFSIFWGGLARVDLLKVLISVIKTFFLSSEMFLLLFFLFFFFFFFFLI